MRALSIGAVVLATTALAACSGQANSPQAVATTVTDAATKAVYNDDLNAMRSNFDDDLRKQVTIQQVDTIASKLKALGTYKGLSTTAADPTRGRYDFSAQFDQTSIPVHVRVDPDGRLAAYRVDLPEPVSLR